MNTQSTLATTLLFTCVTASAFAAEQAIINQANPLDVTMRFYMHPAHLYLSSQAPHSFGEHSAVLIKRSEAQVNAKAPSTTRPHPALTGRRGEPTKVVRSQAGPIYP
jgi:hypothetical protein